MPIVRIALGMALVLALLTGAPAFAQLGALVAKQDSAATKSAEAGAPGAIEMSELPRRLLEENIYVQRAAQHSASAISAEALAQELDDIKRSVDALGEKILGKDFDTLSLSGLEALERHLAFLNRKLSQLQDDLQTATHPLSTSAGELAERRKLWLATREASAQLVPRELLDSIDALNREFQKVDEEVAKPLTRLLKLNREASALQERINNNLSVIQDRIRAVGKRLWQFNDDNLFVAYQKASTQAQGSTQALVNGFVIQMDFLKAYDRASVTLHAVLAVFALIMLPVFLYLSRWARRLIEGDKILERYRTTLSRPVSAWLLFIIMCQLVADFDGPWFRLRVLMALAWLPVMRLQPRWVHDNIGRWIYTIALFFAIAFLCQLISTQPLDYRTLLFVNGILILGSLLWLTYRLARRKNPEDSRKRLMARVLLGATGALLAFAVVANAMGGVYLAGLLTEAALNNLYLALFLCAARELVHAYAYVLTNAPQGTDTARTRGASRLFEAAFKVVNLGLAVAWLVVTMNSLHFLGLFKAQVNVIAAFRIEFGSISITVGGIVLFCASVFLSFWIARTIRGVLSEDVLPKMTLPRGVANSVSTMSYYLMLMLGLLVALSAAGFELSQLALVVGALSVGIGFGLNTVINNFVCGLILMIERPIQPGDAVELSGTTGRIREIGIRATTITTFDGADVLVPNGLLLSEKLTNWTLSNRRRRIELTVGVAYDCSPREVQALLLDVAYRIEGVSFDPPPAVVFLRFGESSLDFAVRVWTDEFDLGGDIGSELAFEIHAALKAAGIEIPFPQRDLHLRSIDPDAAVAAVSPTTGAASAEKA
ncbi:MAG: mechanosensitive ion channel [Propionivibrio sp.]